MDTLRNTYNKLFKGNPKDGDEELGTKEVLELIHPKQLTPLPHNKEEDAKSGMHKDVISTSCVNTPYDLN